MRSMTPFAVALAALTFTHSAAAQTVDDNIADCIDQLGVRNQMQVMRCVLIAERQQADARLAMHLLLTDTPQNDRLDAIEVRHDLLAAATGSTFDLLVGGTGTSPLGECYDAFTFTGGAEYCDVDQLVSASPLQQQVSDNSDRIGMIESNYITLQDVDFGGAIRSLIEVRPDHSENIGAINVAALSNQPTDIMGWSYVGDPAVGSVIVDVVMTPTTGSFSFKDPRLQGATFEGTTATLGLSNEYILMVGQEETFTYRLNQPAGLSNLMFSIRPFTRTQSGIMAVALRVYEARDLDYQLISPVQIEGVLPETGSSVITQDSFLSVL